MKKDWAMLVGVLTGAGIMHVARHGFPQIVRKVYTNEQRSSQKREQPYQKWAAPGMPPPAFKEKPATFFSPETEDEFKVMEQVQQQLADKEVLGDAAAWLEADNQHGGVV